MPGIARPPQKIFRDVPDNLNTKAQLWRARRAFCKSSVEHRDFAPYSQDIDVLQDKPLPRQEIYLRSGATVLVKVTDKAGNPCNGATIVLGSRPTHEQYLQDALSQDGVAKFEHVSEGSYEMVAVFPVPADAPPDYELKRVDFEFELSADQEKRIEVQEPR